MPLRKHDPIRARYYRPLEEVEAFANCLFYVSATLSVVAFFVDRTSAPQFYDIVQLLFVVSVITAFASGQTSRLYLSPRAEGKRREDLLQNAFAVSLSHEQTSGYYNNEQTKPVLRIGAAVLESAFFSKSLALDAAHFERAKIVGYASVWFIALLYRRTDLGLVAVIAQVLFSEQVLSRWLRLEWLRMRYEAIYEELRRILEQKRGEEKSTFIARVLQSAFAYETGKANGNITFSSKRFEAMRPKLNSEWEEVRARLHM